MISLEHKVQRGWVKLQPLPIPDKIECCLNPDQICLLTDDGSLLTVKLAQSLTEQGWKVIVLRFPEFITADTTSLPTSINRVALTDLNEEYLQQQLAMISQHYGSVGAFIHLHPITASAEIAKATIKSVFLIAKHLKKSLNQAAKQGRSWFVTVSHLDGELGIGQQTDFNPIAGGLSGLTKTLNLEWERVFCRAIDISLDLGNEAAVDSIIAELYDPNRLVTEVGYSRTGRITIEAENNSIDRILDRQTSQISSESIFLVSGGGKGITAECIVQLAKYYRCKFILLGRSPLELAPEWAKDCQTEIELKKNAIAHLTASGEPATPAKIERLVKNILSQRVIAKTLQAIAQAGGQAEYVSVDITNAANTQKQLVPVLQKYAGITGIIHGAGVLADKLIEHKSERDFEIVYSTKIEGLQNLLDCVNAKQLQHLILFSSAAGFYGNIGQSDYAIANEILNKFAHNFKRRHPSCQAISFNWGPWESGMVTAELKQLFTQRGVEVIPVEVGTQVFLNQLIAGNPETVQVVVGSALVTPSVGLESDLKKYRIRRQLTLAANPFLQDHEIGGNPVLPATCSVAWMANTCEQLYPGYKFFSFDSYKVLKGIVFDRDLANEYIIDLQEVNKIPEREIELLANIWSETSAGTPRYNYQARIILLRQLPTAPVYAEIDLKQDRNWLNLSPYEDGTLFHGAGFQGIKQILNLTDKKLTMKCVVPKVEDKYWGQIPAQAFNPIAADIQFQCMLLWARHFYQAAGLPLGCKQAEYFRNIPFEQSFYVSMEVQSNNQNKLVADITAHDREGKIYARVIGVELTISKQLNPLFMPVYDKEKSKLIDYWRQIFKVEHPVCEAINIGLNRRFVNQVVLEDAKDFYALDRRPRLYLANHQVGIESMLFVLAVSALSNSTINTVAKAEHQQSWISELHSHIYSYPKCQYPDLIFYFNREDRLSMLKLLSSVKKVITEQNNSLLVHVQGTRSLTCREPVNALSAVFIDLAIELNLPIIPVKFVGGLPVEPLETRLEFPVGYTYQNYHLGKAIYPETLTAMGNLERKSFILERLNQIGGMPETTFPHPSNLDFEREVRLWMQQMEVSEICAVLYKVLEEIPHPTDEVRALLAGIRQGEMEVADSPEGRWLGTFGQWLSGNQLKLRIQ